MRFLAIFTLLLATALTAVAQNSNGLVFTTSTEAVAIHYNNQWNAGNVTSVLVDVFDWGAQKGNSISAAEYTVLASSGFNSYLVGARVVPDISGIVKHTNIPADQFSLFGEAALGNSTFSNATPDKLTYLIGGGAQYRLSPNLSWSTIDARLARFGSKDFYEISSGVAYTFNPQVSKSLAVKRMLVRAKVRQQLAVAEDKAAAAVK